MPKNFEYVFAAYGIWLGVFAIYFTHLYRKFRQITRSLDTLSAADSASEDKL